MGAPLENELLTLNCLSREADRVDYAEYVFSGKVFVKDDQPAVCANPTRRRGTCGNRVGHSYLSNITICFFAVWKSNSTV